MSASESLSVDPDSLIACYGKPRRLPCSRSRSSGSLGRSPPPTRGGELFGGELGTWGPSSDLASPSLDSAMAALSSASTGSLVLLGPRYSAASEDNWPADSHSLTPPVVSRSKLGESGNLSIRQLRDITQKRPQSVPCARIAPLEAPMDPHCIACFGGFCTSSAFPHGPDSYVDQGRRRVGPRPQSQPSSPADTGTKLPGGTRGSRPATVSSSPTSPGKRSARRKARTGSQWSNDGSSLDVADYDELDGDVSWDKHLNSPLGGNRVTKKHEKKSKNPFMEFEDREQSLIKERQCLLSDDGVYMSEKKKDLKINLVQKRIDMKGLEGERLYEGKVFYGPYSMIMHKKKNAHKLNVELDSPALSRTKSGAHGKRSSTHKKAESAEALSNPNSSIQMKLLQRELEFSSKSVERVCEDEEEPEPQHQKKKKKEKGKRMSHMSGGFGKC